MSNQQQCNEYIINSLRQVKKTFRRRYTWVREKLDDQRFVSNKALEEVENLKVQFNQLQVTVKATSNECAALRQELEQVKVENAQLKAENVELKQDCGEVKAECAGLRVENDKLFFKSRSLDDYSRQPNLILGGAPSSPTVAAAVAVIRQMADKAKFHLTATDIYACHTLPSRRGPPRIICKFTSRLMKQSFVEACQKAELTPELMGWGSSKKLLSYSDHLSPETSEILSAAKKTLHWTNKGDFRFVWLKNSRIMAKVAENTPAFEIKTVSDVPRVLEHGKMVIADLTQQQFAKQLASNGQAAQSSSQMEVVQQANHES